MFKNIISSYTLCRGETMKKFCIMIGIWVVLLGTFVSVNAKSELDYQIRYDSHTTDSYEMKNKIQEIYRDLVEGVHKESYVLMVLHNKERFVYKEDMRVSWKDNQLLIVEGDGEGDTIVGTLSANSVCVPEVQPRSFIAELLN